MSWLKSFLMLLLLLGFNGCTAAHAQGPQSLAIISPTGERHAFMVEVVREPQEIQRGLMFRLNMPADQGMLFVMPQVQDVSFWMKNTFIPLDMLFINAQGEVVKIHADAKPQDLAVIPSETPVAAVLEINGGRAKALGLTTGSRISGVLWP